MVALLFLIFIWFMCTLFKCTGIMIRIFLWFCINLPIMIIIEMLGLGLCCTIILFPVGIGVCKYGFEFLFT